MRGRGTAKRWRGHALAGLEFGQCDVDEVTSSVAALAPSTAIRRSPSPRSSASGGGECYASHAIALRKGGRAQGLTCVAGSPKRAPMKAPACRLYLITPPVLPDLDAFAGQLQAALGAGDVAALQIRLKDAPEAEIARAVKRLAPIAHAHDVAVILNDRPDLARDLGCDGVHVGQSDPSVAEARKIMGSHAMIGATCHDSRHLAMEAAEAGVDYVAFGAFFPTSTKETSHRPDPEILTIWQEVMQTPCVAIGGITPENCRVLVVAGADFLAVSAGVWSRPGGPAEAVRAYLAEIARGVGERSARGAPAGPQTARP